MRRTPTTDFEKAVLAGIPRADWDPEIRAMIEGDHGPAPGKKFWTDPSPQWRAYRKAIAEYIARDLRGQEEEPKRWRETWFDDCTGKWVNVDGALYENARKEWELYRRKYSEATVERILMALPFREIREKREKAQRTDIEALVERALKERGERYEFEGQIDFYNVDFILPDRKIVIECDGSYWHSGTGQQRSDMRKSAYIESNGWKVHRLVFAKGDTRYQTAKQWIDQILDNNMCSNEKITEAKSTSHKKCMNTYGSRQEKCAL